jgi:Fe-S-cluster containining protein
MECKRCGTCCEKGGPTLHRQDLALFDKGILSMTDCITHRRGELLHNQLQGMVLPLTEELVKVASAPDGKKKSTVCRFYKPGECTIHSDRPAECRAMDCENPDELAAMYDKNRIARADLVAPDSAMGQLMAAHDAQCDLMLMAELALRIRKSARDREAYDQVLAMRAYDAAVREKVMEHVEADESVLQFLFGRSLDLLFPGYGLRCLSQGGKTILVGTGG